MNVRDLVPWTRSQPRNPTGPSGSAEPDSANSLITLHREVNRLFDDVFRGFESAALGGVWPKLEVEDTDTAYRITAELPGMEDKDVDVVLQDGVLILRGEKRAESEDQGRGFSERVYGRFERRLALEGVDEEKVQAAFRNGVLTVTAPKTAQSQDRAKRIPINQTAH
ncbi:Hsp20/alpha crystallin family protein [Caulobacter sp. S45]|uniref:Hsp20/alpha crystallin family protein n=1 Tax=Caulobacter sp. S45 TaxID=1641861 RepID=UPI00131EB353|nr:Hsp20/alpha crystallin family protein [Caulobacter sp. S45]